MGEGQKESHTQGIEPGVTTWASFASAFRSEELQAAPGGQGRAKGHTHEDAPQQGCGIQDSNSTMPIALR